MAFAEMVTRREPRACRAGSVGGLAPPGQEPRHRVICCTHCTQFSVLPPPRDDPLPLPSHGDPPPQQGPHHSISCLSGTLCLCRLGLEWSLPSLPDFLTGKEGPSPLILESQRLLGTSRVISVTGVMNSNRISTKPSETGVPVTPY